MSAKQLGRLIANNDKIVAILACPTAFTDARPIEIDDPEWDEAMQNGKKIVDALNSNTELLAALQEIEETLTGSLPVTAQCKEIARAAIAKAKGESQ